MPRYKDEKQTQKNKEMNYMVLPGLAEINKKKVITQQRNERLTIEFVKVCQHFAQNPTKVKKQDGVRKRENVLIRQICMLIFKCKLKQSLSTAAGYFGQDHATALHGIKTVVQLRSCSKEFKNETDKLLKGINITYYEKKYA